jgi:hypothetical protein
VIAEQAALEDVSEDITAESWDTFEEVVEEHSTHVSTVIMS